MNDHKISTVQAVRCRYLEDDGQQCSDPALAADSIDICARHAALVMKVVRLQAIRRTR